MRRDTQRQRVYDAESRWRYAMRMEGIKYRQFKDAGQAHAYMKRVLKAPVASQPEELRALLAPFTNGSRLPSVERARKWSTTSWARPMEIVLSSMGMQEATLLHELTHVLDLHVEGRYRRASHGPTYCRTMLALVDWRMGEEAGDLLRREYAYREVERAGHW